MEVRPGYKQTDIGVVPEDWETPAIIDAAPKIIDYRGRTPRKLGMDWGGGDIPALSARNVKMGFIDFDEECYLGSESLYQRWMTNGDATRDDIVFTTEAPLGNVALIPDDQRYILSQRAILLKTDSARVYSPFLFQVMLSDRFQQLLAENASGSTAQGIQRKKFETLRIACPPVVEQRAIAAALSDVDALLAGLGRLIDKKRDLKQAAMQQLLSGQTQLPGFQEGWTSIELGELLSFKNGLNKAKAFFGHGTPIVNYMDVFRDSKLTAARLAGQVSLTSAEIRTFDVRKGDVFFTRTSETTSEIGLSAVMLDDPEDTVFSGFLLRGRPVDNRLRDDFKAYCFQSAPVRQQIVAKATYTTRALTNGRLLSSVVLNLPSGPEQSAIASVLSDIDDELTALEARRDKTRALKQGMMQELLTGRTRLV